MLSISSDFFSLLDALLAFTFTFNSVFSTPPEDVLTRHRRHSFIFADICEISMDHRIDHDSFFNFTVRGRRRRPC